MKEKFYITTAIAYTSGQPHIGNSYEIVLTDAIARFKRYQGYDVYFQTGTDEHGQKIEEKAHVANLSPQEYVDTIAKKIQDTWDIMNTSYDSFVRTTDPKHEKVVQKIFDKLFNQGDIYKGQYEGLYCTPCESFFSPSQLIDGKCPDCGREVNPAKEEAYFFKLSKYAKRLEDYINDHPDFIAPDARKNEMINNFIKPGLQDLCVSRSTFKWGIPVDFDPKHVIYVWIDALTNYITFLGYDPDGSSEQFNKYWPCDVHIIGKDILRFHTIYWPILLMALDLPLPKKVFGHPWLLMNNDKMSKSKGNIMYADDLVNEYGVDAIRYYLLHEIPFSSDGTINHYLITERVNADLANILGNLVQRTISMVNKYFDGKLINPAKQDPIDEPFIELINGLDNKVTKQMENFTIAGAIDEIFELLRASNKYIDNTMPWVLAKDPNDQDRLKTVLYNLLEAIRVSSILLESFLPNTAQKIREQLNTKDLTNRFVDINYHVGAPSPLFQRIEEKPNN